MPMQKRLRDVYVCLECSLKCHRRPFSYATKISNSSPTASQSIVPSSFVDRYFDGVSPLTTSPLQPATSDDRHVDGAESSQTTSPWNQSSPGTGFAEKSKTADGETGLRLDKSQLQSISALGKLSQDLFKESSPTAFFRDAIKQLGRKKQDTQRGLIRALSHTYSNHLVEDVRRDLAVLQGLNRSEHLDASSIDLVIRLTKNGLLKGPAGSPWHRRLKPLQETSQGNLVSESSAVRTASGSKVRNLAPLQAQQLSRVETFQASNITPATTKRNQPKYGVARGKAAANIEAQSGPSNAELEPARRQTTNTEGDENKRISGKLNKLSKKIESPSTEARRPLKRAVGLSGQIEPEISRTIDVKDLDISPLDKSGPAVPGLCHDLARVLFNPGIYQLQDPRSRVYNFDPYLEKIMPVSEFDFKTLKEYITSSRDDTLRSLALRHGKKYVGSSSSMTASLAQFHFLLSQWRGLNTTSLSRGFSDQLNSFTIIQRSPSTVFLRYQDGIYAMDADKEFDSVNILMSLGKSMEKLLTQNPANFERYRKTSITKVSEEEKRLPEAYQYTYAGDMLMRAQLDAYDPRLPGTGTFDLKTRAVASIRHNIRQHEEGWGYQIKTRFGDWESYEREYYDMMRSAFLKYSLQVRMGQMDGIFVAFHNIERIFGFQYVSLPEMDTAIHGQEDTILGNQEFQLSVRLLNDVLNRVTARFPNRSLRLQFETRDSSAGNAFMYIFAEPMDESKIDAIQNSKAEAVDTFERCFASSGNDAGLDSTIGNLSDAASPNDSIAESFNDNGASRDLENDDGAEQMVGDSESSSTGDAASSQTAGGQSERTTEGSESGTESGTRPVTELLALTMRIQNKVNGVDVKRPIDLTASDKWTVEYSLTEMVPEVNAHSHYQASRRRKEKAMKSSEDREAAGYFVRKLRDMAASGAAWRKAQDELDAAHKRIVLYGSS